MKRPPAVAGRFYEGSASKLEGQVGGCVIKDAAKEKVIALMSPHAGLMYSGRVAGAVYSSIRFPETFVFLGPNHTGLGARMSLMASGEWEVPTGAFAVDGELAGKIAGEAPFISEDGPAHMFEHSIEVQLPFLAYFSDSVRIVPILIKDASLEECRLAGEGIARAVGEAGYETVIAASSDMSHYVPDAAARRLDDLALREMLRLDPEGLYHKVMNERITMCGILPATVMLYAAKALGAREARLVKYATSGETSGDYEHVVGYAGVIVK